MPIFAPDDCEMVTCLCCESVVSELNAVLIDGEYYCKECAELPVEEPLPDKPHEISSREYERTARGVRAKI